MKIFITLLCALVAASEAYELTHYRSLRLGVNGKPFCGGYMIVDYYMASRASCLFKKVKDEVTSAIPDMYAFSYLMHSNALSKVIRGYYPHNYKSNEVGCLSDFAILELVKPQRGTFVDISVDMGIEPYISSGQKLTMLISILRDSVASMDVEYVDRKKKEKDSSIGSSTENNPPDQYLWVRMSLSCYLYNTVSDSFAVRDIENGAPLRSFFSGNPILLGDRLVGLALDEYDRDGNDLYVRYTDVGSYGRVIRRNYGQINLDEEVKASWAKAE